MVILKNEKFSKLNGAAAIIPTTIITSFIPLFAIGVLDASNRQIGLISSLPSLMTLMAIIPGAMWINRLNSKKMFTAWSFFLTRIFLLLIMVIPFIDGISKATLLIIFIALMNLPNAVATLSWQSFIGDLIPDKRRGDFFSERNRILTIVGMIGTFSTGFVLNIFDKTNAAPYQYLFLFGFLCGLLEVYYLLKHIEIRSEKQKNSKKNSIRSYIKILVYKPYFTFVFCIIVFQFGWQMAWPLFNLYQINDAHATAFWISLFTVANQISQILSYKWWGIYANKYGNTFMLFIASIGMATVPVLTILSKNLIYLTFINFWSGIFVAGTVLLLFNQLLHVSPDENRTSLIANYNILVAGIGFIAPQVGVYLLEILNIDFAMIISGIIRLLGGLTFLMVFFFMERKTNIQA